MKNQSTNTFLFSLLFPVYILSAEVLRLNSNMLLLLCARVCQNKTSANSYQACHVLHSSTIAYVLHFVSVTQSPLPAGQQRDGDWAGRWAWVPTRPSSRWRVSPSTSSGDPSTTSVCRGPTGGTACWKWRPVASTPSPRKRTTMDVFCFSSLSWTLTRTSWIVAGLCHGVCTSQTERCSTSTHSWI